jgi:hypothetical protein
MSALGRTGPMTMASRLGLLLIPALLILASWSTVSASAAGPSPGWAIKSTAFPTNFSKQDNTLCASKRHDCDRYLVTVTNVGAGASKSYEPVVIHDHLPVGLKLTEIVQAEEYEPTGKPGNSEVTCVEGTTQTEEEGGPAASEVVCTYEGAVPPGGLLTIAVDVTVEETAEDESVSTLDNLPTVEGGGSVSREASPPSSAPNTLNGSPPEFGLQDFSVSIYGADGTSDVQAGDHPQAVTTNLDYTSELSPISSLEYHAVAEPKTLLINLPLGLVGDPLAAEQCQESALYSSHCPLNSRIGTVTLIRSGQAKLEPIYNMVPEGGEAGMFGFVLDEAPIYLRARLMPSPKGYVLSVGVPDIPRSTNFTSTGEYLTFFGDPLEADGNTGTPRAFFTNPTQCSTEKLLGESLGSSIEMDSWVNPNAWVGHRDVEVFSGGLTQAMSGCNLLQSTPQIAVTPETTQADTPSGYQVDVKVPQAPGVAPALATPDLRDSEITLPEGISISPSSGNGLSGCEAAGPNGIDFGNSDTALEQPGDPAAASEGHLRDATEGEEIAADGLPHPAAGHCPAASQVGTVEIVSPIVSEPLKGGVFEMKPECDPCNSTQAQEGKLFGLYVEAAGSGIILKLKAKVTLASSGRLTVHLEQLPQLPFSEFKLTLKGGERAPLANPQTCGNETTTTTMTPWSAPEGGAMTPFSSFAITGCAGSTAFAPGFIAQSTTPTAGGLSPFTVVLSRHDGEQDLSSFEVNTPAGLLGMLSAVQSCPEPQAERGECGAQSVVGHTLVAAGAGDDPVWESGTVYLTAGYEGAPFGLSIVTPALAGPLNLGDIIVRAAIRVNPLTTALTIVSRPIPQIVDGVPLRIQTLEVSLDQPGFMLNPTSCGAQRVTGEVTGALPGGGQGTTVPVSAPYALSGCQKLPFKPTLTAQTQAKTSKVDGAMLRVVIASPLGQAHLAKLKVDLPKALPSRLSTLQQACKETVFEANPAACPTNSLVGQGMVDTPVFKAPLVGPAYMVSHGGGAFPDLEIVLQGEGVTLELVGVTAIDGGITSDAFRALPDNPITRFELTLPEQPYSVVAANANLCKANMAMPTELTGQDGAVLKQTTKISVSGCPKAKAEKKKKKKTSKKRRKAKPKAKKKT